MCRRQASAACRLVPLGLVHRSHRFTSCTRLCATCLSSLHYCKYVLCTRQSHRTRIIMHDPILGTSLPVAQLSHEVTGAKTPFSRSIA
jgi:hypothetical protein